MRWKREGFDKGLVLISASGSADSINEKVMEDFVSYLEEKAISFDILNLRDFSDIPLLLDKNPIPERIKELHSSLLGYGCVVIFAPEHNGYFSAFFKNILDWISLLDITIWENSKLIIVSASVTDRERRIMEGGVRATLERFTLQPIEFINWNRCGQKSEEEKEALYEEIFKHLI